MQLRWWNLTCAAAVWDRGPYVGGVWVWWVRVVRWLACPGHPKPYQWQSGQTHSLGGTDWLLGNWYCYVLRRKCSGKPKTIWMAVWTHTAAYGGAGSVFTVHMVLHTVYRILGIPSTQYMVQDTRWWIMLCWHVVCSKRHVSDSLQSRVWTNTYCACAEVARGTFYLFLSGSPSLSPNSSKYAWTQAQPQVNHVLFWSCHAQ